MRYAALLLACALLAGCSKPMAEARVASDIKYFSRTYAATANDTYYAVRWGLRQAGFPVAVEDLNAGTVVTRWMPVTSDSHAIMVFGHPDYGVTNSYHQLEVRISFEGGRSKVEVGSRVKTLVAGLASTGVSERKVLDAIGGYLRTNAPTITNLGVNE